MMKPVRYEMLGAPTLLYRHDDNSSSNSAPPSSSSSQKRHIIIHQPTTTKSPHQRLFHPDTLTPQQIYMKEYLEMDPFKKWFSRHDDDDDNGGGKKKKKKGAPQPRRKRLREDENLPLGAVSGSIKRTFKRIKSNNDDNNDVASKNSDSSDEDEKKREGGGIVGGKKGSVGGKKRLALKYYTFDFDNGDVPDEFNIANCVSATSTAAAESNLEKRTLKEEFNDEIDDDIIKTGEVTTEETTTTTTTGWNNEVGGSLGYGNCLVAITCTCQCCCSAASSSSSSSSFASAAAASAANVDDGIDDKSDDATASTHPSSFLVHPVGERLSSVTIDKLIMPRDNVDGTPQSKSSSSSSRSSKSKSNTIDIGGTILQIAICGMGVPNNVKRMNQEEDCQSECLVVRTSRYCVVILAKSRSKNDCEGKASISNNNDDDDESDTVSLSSVERGRRCSTTFELIELSRIDLCTSTQSSYLPVYVACDPKVVFSPFVNPSFAILSRSNQDETTSGGIDCTTIHEVVQVGEESSVTKHTISSLANISLLEYHTSEMSVLWAAARATNVPKPYNKDKDDDSGVLRGGYGHSLFKINLRNDSASHVWSPSKAEYTAEGVHSINGIMNDLRYKHIVWVSSSSACKVWALDGRHNAANVVMCFSLAQLSDDFGPELGVAGIYGAGMIMTQPPSMHKCTEDDGCSDGSSDQQQQLQYIPPTMFGVKKDPNAYSLHAYQLPTTLPRFQTMPLEGCSFVEAPVAKYSTSCIARSTIYPLPICSDKTFRVGLATLRCSSNSALRKVDWKDTLGYDEAPDIIYALTMSSVGDIHCHALLECDSRREVQARCMEGMPVGAAAISVPVGKRDDKAADGSLRILLNNDFPLPFNDVALF